MAAASAMYSSTFALPTAPTALSSSQQSLRSANQQPWEHHDHLQPSADSPAFIGAHMSGFVIGAVVALGSAMRHRKRKQKTSTLRFAAKVVATAPVAKKVVESTTDNTRDVRPVLSRKLRPVLSDPDAPKRPMGSFIRYLLDFKKGPKAKGTICEITAAAGKTWKKLSPDKRAQWEKPYEKEKKKYTTERQKYVNSGKRDAWYRDPARPKRALIPYIQFLVEQRKKYSDLAMLEQSKKVAEDWKALAPSKKTKYEKTYAKDKQAFELAMKTYKDSGKEDEWLTKVGITAVREKVEAKQMKLKAMKEKKKAVELKIRQKKVAATMKEKAAKAKAKMAEKKTVVAATMKEKAAKAKAKMAEKKTKATVALKQLRTKQQVNQKLLVDKLKAGKAKKIAAEKKATGLQKVNLAAAKPKENAAKATTKANGADKKTAAVASVTSKAAKDKAEVAPKEKLTVATQKKKVTSAQVEEGIKKKVVTAKLKAATVKAKAKPTAVKV